MTKAPAKTRAGSKGTPEKTTSTGRNKSQAKKTAETASVPPIEVTSAVPLPEGTAVQATANANDAATVDINSAHLAIIADAGEEGVYFDPGHAAPLVLANFITIDEDTKDEAGNVAAYVTQAGVDFLATNALPPHDPDTGEIVERIENAIGQDPPSNFATAYEAQQGAGDPPPPPSMEVTPPVNFVAPPPAHTPDPVQTATLHTDNAGLSTAPVAGLMPPEPALGSAPALDLFLPPPALMAALKQAGFNGMPVENALAYSLQGLELVELGNPSGSNHMLTRLTQKGNAWHPPTMLGTAAGSAATNFPNSTRGAQRGGGRPTAIPEGGFPVRADVALPTERRGSIGNKSKYPFDEMEIGQSFHIPVTKEEPKPSLRYASSVTSANKRYKDMGSTKHFIIRGVNNSDPNGSGARIFRNK